MSLSLAPGLHPPGPFAGSFPESRLSERVGAQLRRGYRVVCFGLAGFYFALTAWRLGLASLRGFGPTLASESALAGLLFLLAGLWANPLDRWLGGIENLGLLLVGIGLANDLFLVAWFRTPEQIVNFILVQVSAGVAFRSRWRFWLVQTACLGLWAWSFQTWVGPGAASENLFIALSGGLFGVVIWLYHRMLLRSLARLRAKDLSLLRQRAELVGSLKAALENVRTLHGLIPICAHCKRIRDDRGYWEQVETYLRERSEATFSHGICPDCYDRVRRELDQM